MRLHSLECAVEQVQWRNLWPSNRVEVLSGPAALQRMSFHDAGARPGEPRAKARKQWGRR